MVVVVSYDIVSAVIVSSLNGLRVVYFFFGIWLLMGFES